jgi:hypothetical protein
VGITADLVLTGDAQLGGFSLELGSSFAADFFNTATFTLDGSYTTESGVLYLPDSTPIPLPPALALLGVGALTLAATRRGRRGGRG